MTHPTHILEISDLDIETIFGLCSDAKRLDQDRSGELANIDLSRQTVALLFDRPSTRTRLGFESGMTYLGGHAVSLSGDEVQFGHGTEDTSDTARAISSFVDGIITRVGDHELLKQFAKHADVPVVNGLSDRAHPCEALADLYFLNTHFKTFDDLQVTWVGDCTNVARSFISVCLLSGIDVRVACPSIYWFNDSLLDEFQSIGSGSVRFFENPIEAVDRTAVVYTDSWVSMGQSSEREERLSAFAGYQVNKDLLSYAPDAIVMHCLPATRGEEITSEVLDGDRSVAWEQAETRLPMQQAILNYVT